MLRRYPVNLPHTSRDCIPCLLLGCQRWVVRHSHQAPGGNVIQADWSLHKLLVAAYFAPLLLAPSTWPEALLNRLLFFDPVLNLASVRPFFDVGQTAASDRLLRQLASIHPERLHLGLWLLSAGITGWFRLHP